MMAIINSLSVLVVHEEDPSKYDMRTMLYVKST